MIIDRDKHNKYVVGWKPNYTVPTNQGSSSGTNVTIVYGGGGSGSSTPVSSEAFSYYKVSDGENAITQEAKVQKDIANLSIIGDEGIKVELITDPTIFEASFTSTGTNKGVYKISYGKVTTVVEKPETQAEEPTEPEVVITFPMTITYVSGEKIQAEQFDTLRLLNNTEEVATYPSSGLAIEGDADGILSISLEVYKEVQSVDEEGKPVQDAEGNPVMEKQGLYFNRILLTSQLEDQPSTQAEGDSTEEEPQQPTYESLLSFDVVVNIDTVIKLSSDSGAGLWKLDDNGNIYTEYNAYSLKELSAYGLGEGEAGEGAGFLHELGDVSIPDPNAIPDNAVLQYNIETGKWEAVELGELDDTATREWVEQKFKDLINGAPADLDTLGEIAIAIQELQQLLDWFSFVDGRIRANYNFWGVGEISAYGPASGSDPGTGGGAGYLHELGDVTINNDTLANGQIIVWDEDSQMWVNTDFPGLDEDTLALYLTQNKYATQEWVNGQLDPINNKLEEFQTTIDMINDMFEWDNGKIKAKATLYSVGEISAYGAGEGSSGTGGYLHELDDVLLTSLQDDQLLMYDATIEKWVNVDKNSVGLNETELEQYLITHNYVTSDQVVLPTRRIIAGTGLTGGGALSSDVTLSLATSGVTSGVYTKVTVDQYGRVTLGALLAENDIPNIAWSKIHSTPTTLAGYGITDAYTMQQSDERYVNVTGDTMTGNLILPTLQANTSIILGSVKLEYDSANKALKISHIDGSTAMNMYATGEVSAYGAGIGSAGGGKEYLHDLLDVLITELADNQLLMYDAEQQKWINIDKDQVGLNETELQNYLTTNQYTTQSWVNQQLEAQLSDKVDKEDGKGLSSNDFTDELLAKLNGITAGAQGTFTKVTTNGYGQVISGTTLSAADIPGLDWSKIISGKPTTLAGYGITDGVNAVSVTGTGNAVTTASISGHTLTLTKALSFALITGTNATGTWPISITGNAATANKWTTARTITLAGAVIGSTSIDGSGNVTITTTYTTSNISALDGRYVNVTGDTMTGNLILPTLQANTSIILGSVKLEYDSASNALKISNVNTQQVINLYATGEISAYGYNSGSAGGGASTLDDLNDVTLSNLQNGQALVYNSSTGQWVNTTIQAGGIDETALAQYLTSNGYATQSWVTARGYLTSVSLATISDLHSSWDAVLKAQKPAWLTTVSLATISDLHSSWDALLKAQKPTTLAGYGITDAYTKTESNANYFYKSIYAPDSRGCLVQTDIAANSDNMVTVVISGNNYSTNSKPLYSLLNFYNYNSGDGIINISCQNVGFAFGDIKIFNYGGYVCLWLPFHHNFMSYSLFIFTTNSSIYRNRVTSITNAAVPSSVTRLVTVTPKQTALTSDNVYSATKLQTARKIWGRPFNGEADVSGALSNATTITASGQIQGGSFKLGNGTITWDSTNNCFHFSHGLYSDSFVSAKGANSGSGGTVSGVTKLSDLSDVQLGTLATNQVLSWNGSKWVNKAISTGLDETALAQYLTNNQYLTMPTGDARYVTLGTTQTISGAKTFSNHIFIRGSESNDISTVFNASGSITVNSTNSLSAIVHALSFKWYDSYWQIGNVRSVSVASDGFGITKDNSNLVFRVNETNGWLNGYPILTSNNYTSYIGNSFVKKAGDTMTGALTVPSLAVSGSTATVSGNKVWHAGNDGSGSGLDADLLDGLHSTDFALHYPTMPTANDVTRYRHLGYGYKEQGWNTYGPAISFGTNNYIRQIQGHNSTNVLFTRKCENGIWSNWEEIALTSSNVASASRLQTARTINGTAFNGTSNIVTSYWGTARTLSLTGNATGSVSMNGSSNVSMSVNVNYATSAGNADTLDGYHGSDYLRSFWAEYDANTYPTNSFCTFTYSKNAPYTGVLAYLGIRGYGMYLNLAYGTGTSTGQIAYRKVSPSIDGGGLGGWAYLARTTDNVYSATKLQTAREIFGHTFNGTQNVVGQALVYGSYSAAAIKYTTGGIQVREVGLVGSAQSDILYGPSIGFHWAGRVGSSITMDSNGNFILYNQEYNGYRNLYAGAITASGNVTAPSFYASNWFRSTGQTGWYNGTYGGGMNMTDSTWIRLYGGKSFYAGNGIIRTDYLFDRQGYAGTSWNNGYGAYNVAITNNSSQTPLLVAYRSGQSQAVTGANRLFSMELLNSGSLMYLCFGGGMRYSLTSNGVFYASAGMYSNGYVSALGQNSSDARLKTNIQDFKATALIKRLHPKSFEWNDLAKSKFEVFRNTGTQYGLIAQDVKEVMPEWVDDNLIGSGYMGIRYDKLIPVLLQGEIETISRVETLEDKVNRLEKENYKLKKKVKELERRAV